MSNYKFSRKRVLYLFIVLLILSVIASGILGIVYYVQGKSTLDWLAPKIAKEQNMTYFDQGYYSYLLAADLSVAIKNKEVIDDPELTISEEDAMRMSEEMIEKYSLHGGYNYEIGKPLKHTYSIYGTNSKNNCYSLVVTLDRKHPKIVINNDTRRKNWLIIWIDNNGIFEICYQ